MSEALPQKSDMERVKVLCPECGFSKQVPAQAIPAAGARATCPKCAYRITISSPIKNREDSEITSEAIPAEKNNSAQLSANVNFQTFTAYDNRFKGKGIVRIEGDHIQVSGRRRHIFSFGSKTENYNVSSIRNVVRKGKVVRFAILIGKRQWQAMLVCADEKTAEAIAERFPATIDSDLYTAQQASQELKDRLSQLPGGTPVTWGLLAFNILIYLSMVYTTNRWLQFDAGYLSTVGGNFSPLTSEGQWWRLLSSTFLHIGLFHLLFNMFALYSFGRLVERLYGPRAFFGLYLLAGFVGSCGTLLAAPEAVGVGASGAIFGVIGIIVVFLATDRDFLSQGARKKLFANFALYGAYVLVNGFGKAGIDNAAHVGGLLSGLTMAWFIGTPLRLREEKPGLLRGRVLAGACLVLLCAGVAVASAPKLSGDYKIHVEMIKLLQEIGVKEIALVEETKILGAKGAKATPADIKKMVQNFKTAYDGYAERLTALQPTGQRLKTRQVVILSYITQKKEGCLIMAQGLERDDKKMVEEGGRKLGEANKLGAELAKQVHWYL